MAEFTLLNNRYQLAERLGSGGMATVYRARDLTLERTVAIKILRKDYSGDPSFRRRFHQEAKAAANLSHPNIVTIHDFGLFADQLFIVMEYVAGMDLKALARQRGRISVPEAVGLIVQACGGIGHAHRAGLVHCDIKPQNLLVTPEGKLKVLDFGIARALSTISPDERSEVVWGSPQYFAPEQAAGRPPSPASDVYSLGVVMYELLAGRLPFTASSAEQLAQMHRQALPPSPRKFNPAIPVALEQITLKVLAKEPAARYRSADQFGRVLEGFLRQPDAPPPTAVYSPAYPVVHTLPPTPGRSNPPATLPPTSARRAYTPGYSVQNSSPMEIGGDEQYDDDVDSDDLIIVTSARHTQGFDWLTWLLALLALLALGGLIPFWLWVMYVLRPILN